ncbi:MAG TPA: acyltransferase [Acidimicrobiales bacterium]|nr:acyltransferase [Acidimicrobiales bacterium]
MPRPPLHTRRYVPAFDGLRAVLVGGVIAYHLSGARLPSATGEVSVIAFFSLSGFLITFLLADEHRSTGTIRIGDFLRRRAVRLLPALGLLLVVWGVVATIFRGDPWVTAVPGGGPGGPISLATIGETVAAAALYVTNWIDALVQFNLWSGYSPLGHLWSLAVEEQFYLVWAPVMAVLLKTKRAGLWISVLAVACLSEPALLYHQGTNRVYFGTDTRMSALLVGAAFGWWWRSGRLARLESSRATAVLGAGSVAALVVAGTGFRHPDVGWQWVGGIVLASLAGTGLVVFLASRDDSGGVAGLLGRPLMVWLGRRSYAIYLWGYVFNTWFRSLGPACPALVLTCTVVAAEVSQRLVEQPAHAWMSKWQRHRRRARHPGVVDRRPAPLSPSAALAPPPVVAGPELVLADG